MRICKMLHILTY